MKVVLALAILCLAFTAQAGYKYTLAQEWPGSICRHSNCQSQYVKQYSGQTFSIHGLWPDIDQTNLCKRIYDCTTEAYNPTGLSSSLQSELDRYWVGFYSDINTFRNHEWSKHGTCWQGPVAEARRQLASSNQESYFRTAVDLFKTYNVFNALANSGIHPSNTQTYSYDQVYNAILRSVANTGRVQPKQNMIQINCYNDKTTGHAMLDSVNICLNDNYQPYDCDCNGSASTSNSCPSTILFPVY